jgi:peptide deformylase
MKSPKIISLVGLPKRICAPLQFPLSSETLQEIDMLKLAFRNSFAEHNVYSLGLSAPQIDVWKRFLIMPKNFLYGEIKDFKQLKYRVREFYTYINPHIVDRSAETVEMNEYCLSIGFN